MSLDVCVFFLVLNLLEQYSKTKEKKVAPTGFTLSLLSHLFFFLFSFWIELDLKLCEQEREKTELDRLVY